MKQIQFTKGCPNQCPYCYEKPEMEGWEEVKNRPLKLGKEMDMAQQVNGHWMIPKFGCDSLQIEITSIIESFRIYIRDTTKDNYRMQTELFLSQLEESHLLTKLN